MPRLHAWQADAESGEQAPNSLALYTSIDRICPQLKRECPLAICSHRKNGLMKELGLVGAKAEPAKPVVPAPVKPKAADKEG